MPDLAARVARGRVGFMAASCAEKALADWRAAARRGCATRTLPPALSPSSSLSASDSSSDPDPEPSPESPDSSDRDRDCESASARARCAWESSSLAFEETESLSSWLLPSEEEDADRLPRSRRDGGFVPEAPLPGLDRPAALAETKRPVAERMSSCWEPGRRSCSACGTITVTERPEEEEEEELEECSPSSCASADRPRRRCSCRRASALVSTRRCESSSSELLSLVWRCASRASGSESD